MLQLKYEPNVVEMYMYIYIYVVVKALPLTLKQRVSIICTNVGESLGDTKLQGPPTSNIGNLHYTSL